MKRRYKAILMIAGLALLLYGIDWGIADETDFDHTHLPMIDTRLPYQIQADEPLIIPYMCKEEVPADGTILVYDAEEGCFRYEMPVDPLKECQEALSSCQAQLDSCSAISPDGFKVEEHTTK